MPPCLQTESDWGEFAEPLTGQEKTAAELQAMTLDELYAWTSDPINSDMIQGPHPIVDGWVLQQSPVKLMETPGGLNAESVLLGANSFDGIFGGFESMAPDSAAVWKELMMGLLGLSGFSLSGTLAMMDQYAPERYLQTADGEPFYPAAFSQFDGDLNVLCPTKWMHQRLGRMGIPARMYCA